MYVIHAVHYNAVEETQRGSTCRRSRRSVSVRAVRCSCHPRSGFACERSACRACTNHELFALSPRVVSGEQNDTRPTPFATGEVIPFAVSHADRVSVADRDVLGQRGPDRPSKITKNVHARALARDVRTPDERTRRRVV